MGCRDGIAPGILQRDVASAAGRRSLVVGVAGGEEGARGFLDAYRASTGERVWRWYSIPKRGEKGSETWIGQALEHGCGATWMPGSYDPQLDLIYWAIGNPCPDIAGEERIGDNLYTSSVVALAAKTGELKWYYQFTPHDTHDWDAVQPMLLVDEVWQGRPRKLLMHGDRNGMFYVLDRTNGEVLLTGNLSTKVTWLKGFTKDGKPIVDPGSIATKEGIAACPGGGGGANFPAASYNPMTKLFYTRVSDSCAIYTSHDDPFGATGNRWFGRGTPGEKARQALAELLKGYRTGSLHSRHRSLHRQEGLGSARARRPLGRAVHCRWAAFPGRRRRPARRRCKNRQAFVEREHRADDAWLADDLHGRRQTIHRAFGNQRDHGVRLVLILRVEAARIACHAFGQSTDNPE